MMVFELFSGSFFSKKVEVFLEKMCFKKTYSMNNECWILLGTITSDATEEKTHKKTTLIKRCTIFFTQDVKVLSPSKNVISLSLSPSLSLSLPLSLCVSHMSTIILLPCSRDWRSVGTCGHVVQCGCLMCTEHVKERLPPKSLQVRGLMWWWRWSILSSFMGRRRTTTTTRKKNNKTCS